jgi:hypothetical protein
MGAAMPSGLSVPVDASQAKERMPSGVPLPTRMRCDAGFGAGAIISPVAADALEAESETAAAPTMNFLRSSWGSVWSGFFMAGFVTLRGIVADEAW